MQAVRVFKESDFAKVNYKEVHLTRAQFEEYKKQFLGKPVPPQKICDDALVALGYEHPDP